MTERQELRKSCKVRVVHLPHTFTITTLDEDGCVEGLMDVICGGVGVVYNLDARVKARS